MYYTGMRGIFMKHGFCISLAILLLFAGCAQSPATFSDGVPASGIQRGRGTNKETAAYYYVFTVASDIVGFSIQINDAEVAYFEGGKPYSGSIEINQWMMSGKNDYTVTVFWPENIKFTPGKGDFKLSLDVSKKSGDTLKETMLYTLKGPKPGAAETYPYGITETFVPEAFPATLLEKAERIMSDAGALPTEDRWEILDIVDRLSQALANQNAEAVYELQQDKYRDIALARYLPYETFRQQAEAEIRDLLGHANFEVRMTYSKFNFLLTADNLLIRVVQGRVGFPEPAIIMTYRENNRTVQRSLDLYFAKIGGRWTIVR
jgi:hypothetical protein